MERDRFEEIVSTVVASLPEEFAERLENIIIVIEEQPDSELLQRLGLGRRQTLLGLYEGIPLTKRGGHYGLVPPDRITIFRKPIESKCGRDEDRIAAEIARVVKHEIGHYFGISDARLDELNM